ncbi:hypothetical protein CRENBAI_006989 [Crenichthys baileyi]|uniref:Uncharacterized protein n=1 Tax=Crenichthys baileyi TaxID=28760 RepID=A0AAV9RTJ6_9TELE
MFYVTGVPEPTTPSALNVLDYCLLRRSRFYPHEQRLKPPFAPVDLTGWQLPLYLESSSSYPVHPPTHTSFNHSKFWTFKLPGKPELTITESTGKQSSGFFSTSPSGGSSPFPIHDPGSCSLLLLYH